VTLNIRLPTECLITHITSIRTLATMYKLVPHNIRLQTECLITHIAGIWILANMFMLMCSYTILVI